jgi:TRAP-type mannitol/chloroaromatic compound transport system permease small subunit
VRLRPALERIAAAIESTNTRIGQLVAWLYPLLVLLVLVHVVLRYVFGLNLIELEELHWHIYAAAFLLAYGYTYVANEHVRVDLLHANWSARTRAWVELFGTAGLLLPFTLILAYYAIDFFWQSWSVHERSEMPGGLPARYVLKLVLLAALVLLALQGIGVAIRSGLRLTAGDHDGRSQ